MEVLALKQVEKTFQRDRKNQLKTHFKSCVKQPKTTPIYRPQKTSRYRPNQQLMLLPVDLLSVDQPTVKFLIVVPPVDRPIDRGRIQRAELSGRLTARSIGARSRELCSLDGRSPGRPAHQPIGVNVLCTSVDRPVDRLLARLTVRLTGRRPGLKYFGNKT